MLHKATWKEYERLLEKRGERRYPRFTYNSGQLEITRFHPDTDNLLEWLAVVFDFIAFELKLDIIIADCQAQENGVKVDCYCMFLTDAARIDEMDEISLRKHKPDLAILSIANPESLILAAPDVPEIWSCDVENKQVKFYQLESGKYAEISNSLALPMLGDKKRLSF